MTSYGTLTNEKLQQMRKKFYADPKNVLAQNAGARASPFEVAIHRKEVAVENQIFSHKIQLEGKPSSNQKSTGRCWLFALLNIMRIPFMKRYNLEEFEFSHAYLFFWDKIERANFFLNNIVRTAKKGEPVDGRLVSFLLANVIDDGGQWDMAVNLVNRYGVVPKAHFPETYSSENSSKMVSMLKSKLREYAFRLRTLIDAQASDKEIQDAIEKQMTVIYRVVGICLGLPPETVTWEYYDKSKTYNKEGPVTPVEFYQNYVKPIYNVDNKVVLVNDPRPTSSYNKLYTVEFLGNMEGGRSCMYNNQPMDLLKKFCVESIKNDEAIWFGCDAFKRNTKQGHLNLKIHDYELTFGTDFLTVIPKADRLLYGESQMDHAMVLTGVSLGENDKPLKFRIENSWGEEYGEKGYFVCSNEWFDEFVFEVVLDRKYLPQEVLDVFKQTPIVLPAWDPMGTCA